MDYKAAYDRLVQMARQRACVDGYSEKHHILPRCLGGSNAKDNLVVLTAEEHFLAHQLLVKINPGHRGLVLALDKMTLQHNSKKRNNKAYGWIRRKVYEAVSERMKKNNPMLSEESRKKVSEAKKKITGANHHLSKAVECVENGLRFDTRAAAGEWLRSIGHTKAHGGSLTEALKDPAKYSAFGFHWKYA